jgi:hypothetical protein
LGQIITFGAPIRNALDLRLSSIHWRAIAVPATAITIPKNIHPTKASIAIAINDYSIT